MERIVLKFGGTSVGSVELIQSVAKRIIEHVDQEKQVVVVVSAMGKTTDQLIHMAKKIDCNPNKRELDTLMATGEQVTIALLCIALHSLGYDAISLTGYQAKILTEGKHTQCKIKDIDINVITNHLLSNKIVVIAGFQGYNEQNEITTLGRGGSDTTAVALAAKIGCECIIYTDVDGIYSVDPRIHQHAKKIDVICYEEMMEMANLGASVLDVRAVEIGCKYKVPIRIAHSSNRESGTYIKERDKEMEEKVITGLTIVEGVMMVTINNVGFNTANIAKIFDRIAKNKINIDMISQTAPYNNYVNVSFTASNDDYYDIEYTLKELKNELNEIVVTTEQDLVKISLVGIGMMNHSGVSAQVFNILAQHNIAFKQVTTSEISISYAINESDKDLAVRVLANELNL